jgi:ATP adenylyltransferase
LLRSGSTTATSGARPPPPRATPISDRLAETIAARARAALASGALEPIETEETALEDGDVRFVVRSVSSLARKPAASEIPKDDARPNPFTPPDAELVIGDITATHFGVLNKYPVVAQHLLIVTREFMDQEALLDATDFAALAACLRQVDGLCFYNGGREAGASQPHRHLQLVPLPLSTQRGADAWSVPMEAVFDQWSSGGGTTRLLRLPFRNAFAVLEPSLFDDVDAARCLLELYTVMLAACGLREESANDSGRAANEPERPLGPYNLLIARGWMLLVPRTRERFGTISVNALGFAGSLFVRDAAEMDALRAAGPMSVLRAVAVPY